MMRPQPLAAHAWQAQAGAVKHRRQVDGDDRIPALHREVFDRGDMLDAGVVDQYVDAAEFALGVGDHVGDLRHIADVGRMMANLAAELSDLGDHRRGIAKAVQNQVRASLGQAQGDAQADAAGGAGDQCGLALKDVMNTSHNASGVERADHHENREGLDQRNTENVFIGLAVGQAGDREQGDDRAVVRQGVHAAAGHRGDAVQHFQRNVRGVGSC
jgi:hypothetical protein